MENERPLEVGDEVVTRRGTVGRVIRITPKAKRVVVDFGDYEDTYSPDGISIGDDIWNRTRIMHMTSEIKRELDDKKAIALCKDAF